MNPTTFLELVYALEKTNDRGRIPHAKDVMPSNKDIKASRANMVADSVPKKVVSGCIGLLRMGKEGEQCTRCIPGRRTGISIPRDTTTEVLKIAVGNFGRPGRVIEEEQSDPASTATAGFLSVVDSISSAKSFLKWAEWDLPLSGVN